MSDSQEVEYEIMEANEGDAAGRKKKGRRTTAVITDELGAEAAAIEAAIERDRQIALIDEKFGDGQEYDRTRLEMEVKTYMHGATEAFLQAGRRLIQLKEHEGHGNFLPSLERIGISEDVAYRMMFTVRRIQNTELANPVAARDLLPSKLYEIAMLDPEQIDELARTGATGEITLDEIQRMTSRETKAALRKEREEWKKKEETFDDAFKKKNDKINDLERQIHFRPEPTIADINKARLYDLYQSFGAASMGMEVAFKKMMDVMNEACHLESVSVPQLIAFESQLRNGPVENMENLWRVLLAVLERMRPLEGDEDVRTLD